eukprot:SAG11_NODE_5235_length_1621_cov_1.958607_1_plen_143_part_00
MTAISDEDLCARLSELRGTARLDLSGWGLGPSSLRVLATQVFTRANEFSPGLVEVVISGNKCFGAKVSLWASGNPKDDHGIHLVDENQTGWNTLCEAMKGSSLQKLGFSDIGIGPIGMKTFLKGRRHKRKRRRRVRVRRKRT